MQTSLFPDALELADDEVLARVLDGETALFEVIVRRYNQRLFRAARAIVRDDPEAEDVLQDAYVKAYAHLAGFEGRSSLSTWLTRIVVNEASARLRAARRVRPLEEGDDGADEQEHPERLAESREMAGLVEAAIDRLPEEFRTVLMLRAVEGLTGSETAECLGIPEETVRTRLFRARAAIQRELEQAARASLGGVHRFLGDRCDRVATAVMSRLGATVH